MQRNNPNRTQYTPNSEFGEAFKIIIQNQLSAQQDWLGLSNRTSFAPAPNPTLAAQIQKQLKEQQELLGLSNAATYTPDAALAMQIQKQLKEQQELLGLSNAATYTPEPNPALAPNPTLAENFETVIQRQLSELQEALGLSNRSLTPSVSANELSASNSGSRMENMLPFTSNSLVGRKRSREQKQLTGVNQDADIELPKKHSNQKFEFRNGRAVPNYASIRQDENKNYYASVNHQYEVQVYTRGTFNKSNLQYQYHDGGAIPAGANIYKRNRIHYASIDGQQHEKPVYTRNALKTLRSRLRAKKAASAGVEGPPLAANDTSIQNLPSLVENPLSFFNPPQNDAHNFNYMMNANEDNSEENFETISSSWGWAI